MCDRGGCGGDVGWRCVCGCCGCRWRWNGCSGLHCSRPVSVVVAVVVVVRCVGALYAHMPVCFLADPLALASMAIVIGGVGGGGMGWRGGEGDVASTRAVVVALVRVVATLTR